MFFNIVFNNKRELEEIKRNRRVKEAKKMDSGRMKKENMASVELSVYQ